MYLKKDNQGFKGLYDRGSVQVYLKTKNFSCNTLEPIHILLEEVTKDNWYFFIKTIRQKE